MWREVVDESGFSGWLPFTFSQVFSHPLAPLSFLYHVVVVYIFFVVIFYHFSLKWPCLSWLLDRALLGPMTGTDIIIIAAVNAVTTFAKMKVNIKKRKWKKCTFFKHHQPEHQHCIIKRNDDDYYYGHEHLLVSLSLFCLFLYCLSTRHAKAIIVTFSDAATKRKRELYMDNLTLLLFHIF